MSDNNLDDSAMLELVPGLRACAHLKRLSLSHNRISGQGALSLATFLSHSADAKPLFGSSSESDEGPSSSDTDTDAFSSDSGDVGAARGSWKPSIPVHTRPGDVTPSDTCPTDDEAFGGGSRQRTHHHFHKHKAGLNELDLAWNNIGGPGASHLLASLGDNSTLEVCQPRSQPFASSGPAAMLVP